MKDGRTHLAHKAEHAIDLHTGAIVGVTVQGADEGDTTTIQETLPEAAEQLEAAAAVTEDAVAVPTRARSPRWSPTATTTHRVSSIVSAFASRNWQESERARIRARTVLRAFLSHAR
jgi:hypothetical protein